MTTASMQDLASRIERLFQEPVDRLNPAEAEETVAALVAGLNDGSIRAAVPNGGRWVTQPWVKQGILLGFRIGRVVPFAAGDLPFFDKHTFPPRPMELDDRVRLVPGGSSVRSGSYLAPGVVCMPPMFVNVGAYVDEGTMIDSHALVGSCAQIGKRVHLSAAAQIGGVLEPVGAMPVIVEDDVFVGGGCGIYEGCIVRRGAVLAPGVILTGSTRLYDLVREEVITRADGATLEVPKNAVVVPGTRTVQTDFAAKQGLGLYAPVIVKYRDERTDASTSLETALR
ncbi:MAG TPA: 2,3,4,5-tetrahydropyridine-2,6-dicarboxylate N-succinyltransferase [Rhodothermales bacterium]